MFHFGFDRKLVNMDYDELFSDISPMDEILEREFTNDVCSSNWSQSHRLGDLVGEDNIENLLLQTRLNLDGFDDSASTISSEPQSPMNLQAYSELFTDEDLIKMSIRDLNKRLKSLPKVEAHKIRKRRRGLKNRGYATSCRQRRTAMKESLETQNQRLKAQLREAKENLCNAAKDRDMYKRKLEHLEQQLHKTFIAYTLPTSKG